VSGAAVDRLVEIDVAAKFPKAMGAITGSNL